MKFRFEAAPAAQEHCENIVKCLMKYGGKTEKEGVELVNLFYKDKTRFTDDDFDLHEVSYDLAMGILYGVLGENRAEPWWNDPKLWPRPVDWFK